MNFNKLLFVQKWVHDFEEHNMLESFCHPFLSFNTPSKPTHPPPPSPSPTHHPQTSYGTLAHNLYSLTYDQHKPVPKKSTVLKKCIYLQVKLYVECPTVWLKGPTSETLGQLSNRAVASEGAGGLVFSQTFVATTASWKAEVTDYVLNESFLFYHFGKDAFLIILETTEIVIQYQVS